MSIAYTVVLCTHNHLDRLARTLSDLAELKQPESPWEFLIIDNGCRDGTAEFLAGCAWPDGWQVRVVREEKLGLSNARNRGIAEARGDYVIFMDDDETADPDWLCAYERVIRDKDPDAIGGRIRVLFEDVRPAWLTDELSAFLGELNRAETIVPLTDPYTSFNGGNFSIRKAVCEQVGNFDDMLGRKGAVNIGGEEVDYYRRLLAYGYRVWWTPEAIIHHRIQAAKLKRSYFLDLHFRQGGIEGLRRRGNASRLPPKYLVPQLARAVRAALLKRIAEGGDNSLRLEMNAAYFFGYIKGWITG